MREIHSGYIIPDYIVERVEVPTDGDKPQFVLLFRGDFDYKNRSFLQHCMTERDMAGKAMRMFFEQTTMLMNIWEDPEHPRRYLGAGFTPEQYDNLVRRCEDLPYREEFYKKLGRKVPSSGKRFVVQYGKAKWPGGPVGKMFMADRDVTGELYRQHLRVDPDKMNPRERVSRTPILFGHSKTFGVPPSIVMADYETGGTAMVSQEYAEREGIKHGDKLWPCKASAVISRLNINGADMIIPKDAIKFEEHRDTQVLAPLMGLCPDLTAKMRSSVEKDRLPKMALDTMQWLYPELEPLISSDARFLDAIALVKRVVEGTASLEEMLSLAEYTDAKGEKAYPRQFHYLKNGHPKEDPEIRRAILQVAGTACMKALRFRVKGRYGVAMPIASESAEMTLLMPPWMLPMRAKGSYGIDNVIGVESDWAIGCLGKDYDGDLAISMEITGLMRKLGLSEDTFPSWGNPADREWAKMFMALPEKKKADETRSVHRVMSDGLKSYGLIGRATNMAMVVIDAMRATGKYDKRQLMGVYLRMMSVEVQPFVDALKYDPKDLRAPVLETKYSRSGRLIQRGMAENYGIDWTTGDPLPGIEQLAVQVQGYFRAVRNMHFEQLADLPENSELAGSFYYRLSRLFAGWKVFQPMDLAAKAQEQLAKHPVSPSLESKRVRSFPMFKGKNLAPEALAQARWDYVMEADLSEDDVRSLMASAWLNKDTRFALLVGRACNLSLAGGPCIAAEPLPEAPQEVMSSN